MAYFPPRRVKVKNKLQNKLYELEKAKMIEKIDSPNAWVSNSAQNYGSLRFPRELNKYVIPNRYLIQTSEEIRASLVEYTFILFSC